MKRKTEELEIVEKTRAKAGLEQEDKRSKMRKGPNRKTKNILKLVKRPLETALETNMKKEAEKIRKEKQKIGN